MFRRVGMKRKMDQPCTDVEFLLKFFNTHGTEVTPGSDIVRENEQLNFFRHNNSCNVPTSGWVLTSTVTGKTPGSKHFLRRLNRARTDRPQIASGAHDPRRASTDPVIPTLCGIRWLAHQPFGALPSGGCGTLKRPPGHCTMRCGAPGARTLATRGKRETRHN